MRAIRVWTRGLRRGGFYGFRRDGSNKQPIRRLSQALELHPCSELVGGEVPD